MSAMNLAHIQTWPAPVRQSVRSTLLHDVTDDTSPALHKAIREITDLIDQAALVDERAKMANVIEQAARPGERRTR